MKKIITTIAVILTLSTPTFAQDYDKDELVNINVYEKISPAIVAVTAQLDDGVSEGTGCIITTDGQILTGWHVVEDAKTIDITTSNGKTYKAKLVAKMKDKKDLAILKIETKEELPIVSFGDSEEVKVGQKVLTIGNPFGFSNTLTQGIISRIDYVKNRFQTDAAINPGCSGGPILNSTGEVIGISQSIYNPDHNISNIGIGFAIPSNEAVKFIATVEKKN